MKTITYHNHQFVCPTLEQAKQCECIFTFACTYPGVFCGLMSKILGVPEISFHLVTDISEGENWLTYETSFLRYDIAYVLVFGLVLDCTIVDKDGECSFYSLNYGDFLDVLKSYINS